MAPSRSRFNSSSQFENSLHYSDPSHSSTRISRSERLIDIINVDPRSPYFTCVGWAPSKGRRCHNPIARHNRSYASALLEQGTNEYLHGEDISHILEELAPRVLCKRFHQNQGSRMVGLWEKRVSDHREDQIVRAHVTRRRQQRAEHSQQRNLQLPAREESSRSAITGFGLSSVPVHQTEVSHTSRPSLVPRLSTRSFQRVPQDSGIDRRPTGLTARAEPVVESSQLGSITYAVRKRMRLDETCPICQEHFTLNPLSQTFNGRNIAWCRARCGTNFHNSCITEWKTVNRRASQLDLESTAREINCPCCRALWLDGDEFSDPELEVSEETETTNNDDYNNGHHGGSQQLHQGEVYEAADNDTEEEEEVEVKVDDDEVEGEVEQQQQQQQREEEGEGEEGEGEEGEGEEGEGEEGEGEKEAQEPEQDHEAEASERVDEEEEGEEEGGDETTCSEFTATNDTNEEDAAGQETERNPDELAEDSAAPITALSQQETETKTFGDLCPQRLDEDLNLSGYMDATILLFTWILGL
ncbi:hypothetical protein AJ79_01297 [Helicocarpus griseus UAMH5409]|uniref:RING-type domain-containing protein n=1 Tax=Helicocarpus griseus UAMH5409 TaxID=1447875 RepID=A0A2B7Y7T1_9EURO|nr:hypothetical protein AJ79_01297 [Helicocarpus griseus UAMH5409]